MAAGDAWDQEVSPTMALPAYYQPYQADMAPYETNFASYFTKPATRNSQRRWTDTLIYPILAAVRRREPGNVCEHGTRKEKIL